MFGQIFGVSFFIYLLLISSTLTLFGIFMKGANRIRYGEEKVKPESENPLVEEDSEED